MSTEVAALGAYRSQMDCTRVSCCGRHHAQRWNITSYTAPGLGTAQLGARFVRRRGSRGITTAAESWVALRRLRRRRVRVLGAEEAALVVTIVSARGGLAMLLSRRIDALSTRAGQLGLPGQCLVAASTDSKSALGHDVWWSRSPRRSEPIATRHGGIHHGGAVLSRRLSLTFSALTCWFLDLAGGSAWQTSHHGRRPGLGSRNRDQHTIITVNPEGTSTAGMHHLKGSDSHAVGHARPS